MDALLKVREWSELAAGPRWKTFIRRFGRGPRPHHHAFGGRKLNYDALSYALNFDEGDDDDACADAAAAFRYRNFNARLPPSPPAPVGAQRQRATAIAIA